MQRLTEQQTNRLQNLIACGPLDRRPVDTDLIELGWAQIYDDMPDAIEAHALASEALYDDRGCIKDRLLPQAWLDQKRQLAGRRER
jgi:hypothetical protein